MPAMVTGSSRGGRARLAAAGAGAALVLGAAVAAAAGPLHGASYVGAAPSSGVSSEGHHRLKLHAGGTIVLKVSRNGRSVTVGYTSASPIHYCRTSKALKVQRSHSTSISGSGSFRAAVSQRFQATPGPPPIVQIVSGRFNGRSVSGKIETRAAECSGVSYFSARAR